MSLFPINELTPIAYPGPPPQQADVVVIGGGIIGVCTALFLARRGKRVVLAEKGRIAGEQSSRNWGWIRQLGRDYDEIPIVAEAQQLWRELAAAAPGQINLVQGGIAYMGHSQRQVEGYAQWLARAEPLGAQAHVLDGTQLARLIPGMSRRYAGALFAPGDMRAEPWTAVPALAALAAREGAHLIENCAVRGLDLSAGRVTGVFTEAGRIATPQVVLAGGAWSSLFLQNLGVALPQLSVRATVAATHPLPQPYGGGAADNRLAFRARADGGYSLAVGGFSELFVGPDAFRALPKYRRQLASDPFGVRLLPFAPPGYPDGWGTARRWSPGDGSPFEAMRILNPAPNRAKIGQLQRRFSALFPDLGPVRIKLAWAGMIDTMPDIVPVVDRIAAVPGLTVGTGMSGHGFGIGPAMGRILAALAMGEAPGHDLTRFRYGRFFDGSAMRLGPSI